MTSLIIGLLGLTVVGAVFATIYYAPDNLDLKEKGAPAFQLAPGEAEQTTLDPVVPGSPMLVQVRAVGGPFDLYVLAAEWSDILPKGGQLHLDHPFSYDAKRSIIGLNGTAEFTLVSDGVTPYDLILDNSDSYYANDTVPDLHSPTNGTVSVQITVRYLVQEHRTLILGYVAAAPSVLLVLVTAGRKIHRMLKA
jgi:hypothetical protein